MSEIRFSIFGRHVAIRRAAEQWAAFWIGQDGKRRPADFVIPDFVTEPELQQFLEDLFHEEAMPWNGDVEPLP